jgi:O-antigen ligase
MAKTLTDFKYVAAFSMSLLISAIWNIPHTIALRYFLMLMLVSIIVSSRLDWRICGKWSVASLILFTYIIGHAIAYSPDVYFIFNNYWKEWLKFILVSIIGAGVGLLISERESRKVLLYFGAAFSVPLIVHIVLFVYRWILLMDFPWGYWGINQTHGDLAYASLQATAILGGYLFWQAKERWEKSLAAVLLFVCLLSPLLASSRGGVAFTLVSMLAVISVYLISGRKRYLSARSGILIGVGFAVLVATVFNVAATFDPERWNGLVSRFSIGFEGDPLAINCNGVAELRRELEQKGPINDQLSRIIEGVNVGDGSRIMTARAGLRLLAQHPMGINGATHAYQIAINQICDPVIKMSHTHNAWIDTALAIGVPGAVLLLAVFLTYAVLGLKTIQIDTVARPFGAVLFLLAIMWIIRGVFDSTQRDHMLEMQAFILPFLAMQALVLKNRREIVP